MIIKPTVTDLLTKVDNRFELIIMTSKRARQLSLGDFLWIYKDEESKVEYVIDFIIERKTF